MVETLNHNYLSALLSSDKLPSYPMPTKPPVVAPPTATTANAGPEKPPRKARSDKGVPKSKPPASANPPTPANQGAAAKKRKSPTTPTSAAPAAGEGVKPKKPRVKKPAAVTITEEPAEPKPKKVRAPKTPKANGDASAAIPSESGGAKSAEKKHVIEISAAEVRRNGIKNNPLDKIKSVNAPPTDEASNVLLPGYPTIGSIFAEVYSTHRTVDNRLNSFGENLTKFMAAQYATNDELKRNYEKALEKMQEMHRQDSHTGDQDNTQADQQPYSNIDEMHDSIVPLTP